MGDVNRLKALNRYKILGAAREEALDDIVKLTAELFNCPLSLVNLIGETECWFKASVGTDHTGIARKDTFCDTTIRLKRTLIIQDTQTDQHFAENHWLKLNTPYRFYAGAPLISPDGYPIGTLCVLAREPRTFTEDQRRSLERLAGLVVRILEDRVKVQAQEEQKQFLDVVLENLSDGVIACDESAQLTLFNHATRVFHGVDSDNDLKPEDWNKHYQLFEADGVTVMPTENIPLLRAFNDHLVKDQEMMIRRNDGVKLSLVCSGNALYDKEGKKLGAVIAMQDITDRKKAQAKLEATNRTLQSLIDTCPVGIFMMNSDLTMKMWNPGCEKIYGWSSDEMIGHPLPFNLFIRSDLQTKSKFEVQGSGVHKNGKEITVKISMVPELNEHGEVNGFFGVVVDVSEIKQRETALMEANRALRAASVAKSEFLANMSHEIRTPLNGVLGVADLILDTEIAPELREQVGMIQTSAENLLVILGDILDFSKVEAGKLEIESTEFNFDSIIGDLRRNIEHSAKVKKLDLNWNLAKYPTHQFMGDPVRIQQVITNLVSNAIKFTATGSVTTDVTFQPGEDNLTIVDIRVTDSGIGISKEAISRLFQAFTQADNSTTRRYGGTGLGLSISKQLITLMGGRIGVESTEGKGSTFWVQLPLRPAMTATKAEAKPSPSKSSEPAVQYPYRVLVAEDTPDIRMVSMRMLEKIGLKADAVVNGREALDAVKATKYDLILMDCQMPEMDGYDATRKIRLLADAERAAIPIIAVTAHAMVGDREKCIESGMTDYLPKPVRLKEMEEAIARYLPIRVRAS